MKVPYQLPPGVARGATPAAMPGRWFDTNLMRWRANRLQPIGGWERMTEHALPSTPRALATWVDNSDVRYHALGCDSHLLLSSGDAIQDITPLDFRTADSAVGLGGFGAGKFGADEWGTPRPLGSYALARAYSFSLAPWGQDLLAVASFDGRLMHWSPDAPTERAEVIDGAPQGLRACIVTAERHVVVIGGSGTPRQVSWCSQEDYTDWNFASVTNTAGWLPLNTDGLPVAMARVREGILIFTEIDVWLLRYVGAPYIHTLERIGETTTLISPNAVATFGGRAVWMGREGFFLYDGGFVKALPCDVGAFLLSDIDPMFGFFRTHASANGSFPEVWWWYPSADKQECNRYVIWNYEEGWWAIGSMERTAAMPAGVAKFPLATGPDRHLYQHETGWTAAGISRKGLVYASGPTVRLGNGDRAFSVLSAFPDLADNGQAARFLFTVRDAPDGPARAAGPYRARSNGYMDCRFTGRDVQLTVTGDEDDLWSVGVPVLECRQRGGR